MPAHFTPISNDDLNAWIASAKRPPEELRLHGVRERVLFWGLRDRPIGVAVYTSVVPGQGARDAGEDVIRVVVFDRGAARMLSGTRRIHRTQGWAIDSASASVNCTPAPRHGRRVPRAVRA